jgi:hypothetical protein
MISSHATLRQMAPDAVARFIKDRRCNLFLLCHKTSLRLPRWQQGQRGKAREIATRRVAIELMTWRSGRIGGSAGSMTGGKTRFFDE